MLNLSDVMSKVRIVATCVLVYVEAMFCIRSVGMFMACLGGITCRILTAICCWLAPSHRQLNNNFPRPPLSRNLYHALRVVYVVTCVDQQHQLPFVTVTVFVVFFFVFCLCYYCDCTLFAFLLACLFTATHVPEQKLNDFLNSKFSILYLCDRCICSSIKYV